MTTAAVLEIRTPDLAAGVVVIGVPGGLEIAIPAFSLVVVELAPAPGPIEIVTPGIQGPPGPAGPEGDVQTDILAYYLLMRG